MEMRWANRHKYVLYQHVANHAPNLLCTPDIAKHASAICQQGYMPTDNAHSEKVVTYRAARLK